MKSRILRDVTSNEIYGDFTRFYEINDRVITIGRSPDNTIVISSPPIALLDIYPEKYNKIKQIRSMVSRLHAELFLESDGIVYVVNKSKKNKTYIERQGEKSIVEGKEQLFENDILILEAYKLRLEYVDREAEKNLEKKLSNQETTLV